MESGAFAAWVSQPLESAAKSFVRVARKLGCTSSDSLANGSIGLSEASVVGALFHSGNASDNQSTGKGKGIAESGVNDQVTKEKKARETDHSLVVETKGVDIECLLAQPARKLVRAAPLGVNFSPTDSYSAHGVPHSVAASNPLHTLSLTYAPTIDNVVLSGHPLDLLQNDPSSLNLGVNDGSSESGRVSVLQGWNKDEGTLLSPIFPALGFTSPDELNASLTNLIETRQIASSAEHFLGAIGKWPSFRHFSRT